MSDTDGYPTLDDLHDVIDFSDGSPAEYVEIINAMWWSDGFQVKNGRNHFGESVKRLFISTWGWSGNEEIIGELQKTWFWLLWWQRSERGGHYMFEIPLGKWQEPQKFIGKVLDHEKPESEKEG